VFDVLEVCACPPCPGGFTRDAQLVGELTRGCRRPNHLLHLPLCLQLLVTLRISGVPVVDAAGKVLGMIR
jgi:hypothetical protein